MTVVINIDIPRDSIVHTEIDRTYTEGLFFCVVEKETVYKYRISNIWLIVETKEEKDS